MSFPRSSIPHWVALSGCLALLACEGSGLAGARPDADPSPTDTTPGETDDDTDTAEVDPGDTLDETEAAEVGPGDTLDDTDTSELDTSDVGPGDTDDTEVSEVDTLEDTDDTDTAEVDPGGPSVAAPPARVIASGSGGYLLRGVVVSGDAVYDPGEVLFIGDEIRCVAADCTTHADAPGVTVIETRGVISPGLIDAHNHITYNFLTEWEPNRTFDSRDVWRDDPGYRAHVAPYSDNGNDNDYFCPAGKWGELRSIIHGTTTIQGQSFNRTCLNRLARNADHHHGVGDDHMGTTIASPADINNADAFDLAERFSRTTNATTRYAVHMCEGFTGSNMAIEFESYAGRDPRTQLGRHQGLSLLAHDGPVINPATGQSYLDTQGNPYNFVYRGVAVLIHSILLTSEQIVEVVETDSMVVWSPSSNLVLYGHTAPIAELIDEGAIVGIGPDWTPSGADELLTEFRAAYDHGQAEAIGSLTWERIWRMATVDGAEVVGLGDAIGRLELGYKADIVVFGRRHPDPYRAIGESRAADVRLVFIDGNAYFGDLDLEPSTAVNASCEDLDACGTPKFICAANTPGAMTAAARPSETVADLRAQLLTILGDYDRDDLNELVICD